MNMTSKVTELTEPVPGWRYHSGTTIYTERFSDGRLIAEFLQNTGVPYFGKNKFESGTVGSTPAFELQIDGESISVGWELAEADMLWERWRLHFPDCSTRFAYPAWFAPLRPKEQVRLPWMTRQPSLFIVTAPPASRTPPPGNNKYYR